MFTLPDYLWLPQRRGLTQAIQMLEAGKSFCLYGPTGSGKTEMATHLFRWCDYKDLKGKFYLNRKLLIPQALTRFRSAGLHVGVRAAEYEDMFDVEAPFQIASADTERSRVYQHCTLRQSEADLVIIDEGHIQKAATMQRIVKEYRSQGSLVVILTATPIGISHMVPELLVSGTMQEYRDCQAIVLATVKSIEQPDLDRVKREAKRDPNTGEFILDERDRKIYVQSIIGNVKDRWAKYNPDARAAFAYWPCKASSVWGTKQFTDWGVPWCHVDATDAVIPEFKMVQGVRALRTKRVKLTRTVWADISAAFRDGRIVGLSSRFKLREGIDFPHAWHCILATPIGSMKSYIQTVGRVLRYSPETPDGVLVTDHGGNYYRNGSPNQERPWHEWWSMKEGHISLARIRGIRDHGEKEPIRCPNCEAERLPTQRYSMECPHCGFVHQKSQRRVIELDGNIKVVDGPLIKPTRVSMKPNTQRDWERMFWAYRNGKKNQSFAQMEAFFCHEHGYHPPRNIPYMPLRKDVWYEVVWKVPFNSLTKPANLTPCP